MTLSEGHYNETLLPILLASAPAAGTDIAPLQASMDVVIRDKNAALDALDKVNCTHCTRTNVLWLSTTWLNS